MRRKISLLAGGIVLLLLLLFPAALLNGAGGSWTESMDQLDDEIKELMEEGDIPGLTLVMVTGAQGEFIRSYGSRDVESRAPVTAETLFQLASCSKAFTALAAQKLAAENMIRLDDPVSKYLPWFFATYNDKEYPITLNQLLYQTSGIPPETIDLISRGADDDALEQTVRRLAGVKLKHPPGSQFEYATINYDVIGLVIEKVSGLSYAEYMARHIFTPLGLDATRVGSPGGNPQLAGGCKIGFFKARPYEAPVYRGNHPAGYVVSSGEDMARWLKLQMGLEKPGHGFDSLIPRSHRRDKAVSPGRQDLAAYAMGWRVYVDNSGLVDHGGLNPNFTAYVGFKPAERLGVAVLANSNSAYTQPIGRMVLNFIGGQGLKAPFVRTENIDKASSVISLLLVLYLLLVIGYWVSILLDLIKGRRRFEPVNLGKIVRMAAALVMLSPFLLGIYLLPRAMGGVSWATASVWSPVSLLSAVAILLAGIGASYVGYLLSSLFPPSNAYLKQLPMIVILSALAGGANAVIIFLITSSLFSATLLAYQLYYFSLAFLVYILGRKVIQTRLIEITFRIVYDLRMRLVGQVFLTSYQRFERLDRGRVFATLNDDTGQIGNSANIFVALITSFITIVCAFVYLAAIAFWATAVTLLVVIAIATIYGLVMQKARVLFEEARDTQNVFMRFINGLIDGFKELSLQINKKREYQDDVEKVCDEFRAKLTHANVSFINAFLIGESLLIVVLGAVSFAIPRLFPHISTFTLMSFIMILLYLIGPFNVILNAIPNIMRIRVSWNRVKGFEADVPANIDPHSLETLRQRETAVENLKTDRVMFAYRDDSQQRDGFTVGPIDLEFNKGEITFIIGGNGSGKTTLAKLLTGLYKPNEGSIRLGSAQGSRDGDGHLGEYFSTVFSDYHLFEKLYNVDLKGREDEVSHYLKALRLEEKVSLNGNAFSTTDLSGGQRKRLALLQCYLENSPIYLFDEVAADQDPEFRKFFYRDLLLRMKKEGKIVIAITHDDHYFDVADKIIKMDMGKIDFVGSDFKTTR